MRKPQRTKEIEPNCTIENNRGRPDVILEILFERGCFIISVNNIGNKPAVGVSVKFDKKIVGLDGRKEISALPLFKNIEFLGPRREIVTLLDASYSYFRRKQPTKISAQVSYSDCEDNKYKVTIKHDLEIYRDLAYLPLPSEENRS